MKRFFSRLLIALACLCGAIMVAGMLTACFANNAAIVHAACATSWINASLGFVFAVFGTDLSD